MAVSSPALTKRRNVTKRTRVAHHEAGHAVLSAAINDSPSLVSIRPSGVALGRSRYRMEARPERLVQVHLAGFAAEEILKGHRARQLSGPELGFSIVGLTTPSLADVAAGLEGSDQYLAVQGVLSMGCSPTNDAVRNEIERLYRIAKASIASVWPTVVAVAKALLEHSELDNNGFLTAIAGHQIYTPIFAVQEAHGLL